MSCGFTSHSTQSRCKFMSYDGLHGVPKISHINHDIIYKAGRTKRTPHCQQRWTVPRSQITCRTCGEFREVWTCGICPREGVLAAVLYIWPRVFVCLCPSVCLSQVGVLSKRLNKSSWFSARELSFMYPTLR